MPPVAAALAPYVDPLVCYDSDLGEPGVHIGMPSTSVTVVLAVGEALDVGWEGRAGTRRTFWANVSGLHTAPAQIHHGGRQSGVQLALTTSGARALLGVPAGPLAGELLDLSDVAPGLRDLPERLAEVPPDGRQRTVETALLDALVRHGAAAPRAEVGRSLAGLARGRRVREVADEVGYSRRHLGDLVRAECGLSPKEYQRVARFQRAHALVRRGARSGALSLAAVAVGAGYADQSHLTREWRALAGCSPTQWLRRELPFVHDPDAVAEGG